MRRATYLYRLTKEQWRLKAAQHLQGRPRNVGFGRRRRRRRRRREMRGSCKLAKREKRSLGIVQILEKATERRLSPIKGKAALAAAKLRVPIRWRRGGPLPIAVRATNSALRGLAGSLAALLPDCYSTPLRVTTSLSQDGSGHARPTKYFSPSLFSLCRPRNITTTSKGPRKYSSHPQAFLLACRSLLTPPRQSP